MKRRFIGPWFSLGWILFQSAASAWMIWRNVPVKNEAFLIWTGVPIAGFISYVYGRLDQRNIDLRNEIQKLESEQPNFQPLAKLKSIIHFTVKEE